MAVFSLFFMRVVRGGCLRWIGLVPDLGSDLGTQLGTYQRGQLCCWIDHGVAIIALESVRLRNSRGSMRLALLLVAGQKEVGARLVRGERLAGCGGGQRLDARDDLSDVAG